LDDRRRQPQRTLKRGITIDTIPLGSELLIDGYQARDGSNRGVGRTISFADGRPLFFVGSQPTGEPAQ
jgi:hypothetical protein